MVLKPPNMKECDPKKKCAWGVNEGLAYTPGDECYLGFDFNPDTCDCEAPVCDTWIVDFETMVGGTYGCSPECGTGATGPNPGQSTLTFLGLTVTYSHSVNYGSVSSQCSEQGGPINCGETVGSWTGADYYIHPGENIIRDADTYSLNCGVSDSLYAIFTVDSDPNNGIYAGSQIARLIVSRFGGAVGCWVVETWVTGVSPHEDCL